MDPVLYIMEADRWTKAAPRISLSTRLHCGWCLPCCQLWLALVQRIRCRKVVAATVTIAAAIALLFVTRYLPTLVPR